MHKLTTPCISAPCSLGPRCAPSREWRYTLPHNTKKGESHCCQTKMALSASLSSALPSSISLPTASINSTMASIMAVATAIAQDATKPSQSWLGMLGRAVLFIIRVIPGILYWLITFTTITMPTFLFTLFSTSLTFTMNATTL